MSKFRKKPVVIDAVQYRVGQPIPEGMCGPGIIGSLPCPDALPWNHIHTLEGAMKVTNRDWVITGVKGEKYPCKPDIFEATYEAVS